MANTTKKPFKSKLYGCFVRSVGIMWVFIFGIIIGCVLGFLAGRYYPVLLPSLVTIRSVVASKTIGIAKLDKDIIFTVKDVYRMGEQVDVFFTMSNNSKDLKRLEPPMGLLIRDNEGKEFFPWVGVVDELMEEEVFKLAMYQSPPSGYFNPGYGPRCCWHLIYRIPEDRAGLTLLVENYTIPLE